MTDFLLELRSEEIPARMQVKAKEDLARLFAEEIAKSGLKATSIEAFATPRRLALIAHGLSAETAAVSEELKGPRASAPPQALEGFLRKTGLTREQLVDRDGVLFAVIDKPGRPTAEVLGEAVPAIIRAFPWPKSMRWGAASLGTESLRWVRPLQGIVALFGDAVVPIAIEGIHSGRETMGHRFHHTGPVGIASAADYVESLHAAHVIVHLSERVALIRDGARAAAVAEGLVLVEDEGLVIENAGLTEWPVPLLGRFDPAFLGVPSEVIQLTMRTNQKYFACTDTNGKLANAFVCTANIEASDGGAGIVLGNQKVLAARLSDAKFFWEQDLKVSLEDRAKKLSQIVFREGLGTVADKVERVAKLARWLVETGVIKSSPSGGGGARSASEGASAHRPPPSASLTPPPEGEDLASLAETAARLCKADLVTGMVGEFPELQGVMGGYYARTQGYPDAVADAIRDHYKPVGQGDDVPTDAVTVAVSLADKLDSLVGYYGLAELPTGSRDPYGIRRLILSVISIVIDRGLRLEMREAFRKSFEIYAFHQRLSTIDTLGQQRVLLTNYFAEPISGVHKGSPEEYVVFRATGTARDWREDWEIHSLTEVPPLGKQVLAFEWVGEYLQSLSFINYHIVTGFADRLKVQQREAGVRHDLIDAVFGLGGEDDLVRLLARVKALQAFVTTDEGANLLAGYKRAANILKKEGALFATDRHAELVSASILQPASSSPAEPWTLKQVQGDASAGHPAESGLTAALATTEPLVAAAIAAEDFEAAMVALAQLRAPIDAFFETVIVNDPDPAIRARRLGLLENVRKAAHLVADFSKIEG